MKTAEEILQHKPKDMICVSEDTSIAAAARLMNANHIGSILVKRGGEIVGIWTERDLLRDSLKEGFDIHKNTVGEFMSKQLQSASATETVYGLMDKFLGRRMRHLLIEKEGRYIGLLSVGDVMRAMLSAKDDELKRLNAMAGWNYYEDWKWERSRVPPVIHNDEGLRVDIKTV